jgi:aldehyde dehydrogenase (NAD+)
VPLISATGSTRMGRHVGSVVAERLGRSLLELGGNNAIIVHKDADLDLALRGIVFGAVRHGGPALHHHPAAHPARDIADGFCRRARQGYESIPIGDPLESARAGGPAHRRGRRAGCTSAPSRGQGPGRRAAGRRRPPRRPGHYVRPTMIRANPRPADLQHETFAPILYVFTYKDLGEAIAWQNDVPQGLSSAIFTDSFRRRSASCRTGLGLRHRQRQHRHLGRRDRRRVRRREGDGRRPRGGLGLVEGLHAPPDLHAQLV